MNKVHSAYIHIPFCKNICSYCDFCKMFYNEKWINKYLNSLEKEINTYYKNELLKTIYIGGGTPNSLNDSELEKLLNIIDKLKKQDDYEYTIECNIELLTERQIQIMKAYGINRISIGVQTFQNKFLKFLNRNHTKEMVIEKINLLKKYNFKNINIDLMYAFPEETLEDLENDLNELINLEINHISTYSLMIEPHTVLYNKNIETIDEELDEQMYKLICSKLNKYNHYEFSNFATNNYESKHNLTYWNNEQYYGFGLGASGYIEDIRYTNTKNLNEYFNNNYRMEENKLTKRENMENEMILGLRKLKGVSLEHFYNKYNERIEDVFNISKLLDTEELIISSGYIKINEKNIYVSNDILINFIGSEENE